MHINLNGKRTEVSADWAEESLLFWLREHLGLTGSKLGCGIGACGACTIIMDGIATRSCITIVSDAAGRSVRTIEGLAEGEQLHPVQKAWLDLAVPQCGYCQAGQIMSTVALLEQNPLPSESEINEALEGNLCRCGTYTRIRKAIAQLSGGQS